jgi:hypothetical protein
MDEGKVNDVIMKDENQLAKVKQYFWIEKRSYI